MGKMVNGHNILVSKSQGKNHSKQGNIKMGLKEIG
jgi:hypothetical protein